MPRFRPFQVVIVLSLLFNTASMAALGNLSMPTPHRTDSTDKSNVIAIPSSQVGSGDSLRLGEDVSAVTTGTTTRVSVTSDGTQGNSYSEAPFISADGRYVAFGSSASNLVSGDTNGYNDAFVHDRQTSQTTRVSVASDSTQGNYNSGYRPSISADGRYVAFDSPASNLVSGDTNDTGDVFVHDRQTGQTTRVSVASDGTQGNDCSGCYGLSISADGRYVAFISLASNLVGGDTSAPDVFVHDRQTGQTTRVSVASDGTQGNSESYAPSISADGRYVAFDSYASNLVSGDTNGYGDIFVHDRQTGQTTRVSVTSDGTQGNSYSEAPSISAGGRYVVFWSSASNLVNGDTNTCLGYWTPGTCPDIFVHDRQTGQTMRVSVASGGTQGNNASGYGPPISADGRYIAFYSKASNLVPDDTNGYYDVFVHDRQTGQTTRVSVASDGTQGNNYSYVPSISADGRYVAFESGASNLVSADTNDTGDVFVHDRDGGVGPDFTVTAIEVTQGIQTITNSVPLIAGKLTAVRVYVDCGVGCAALPNVTGVLRGYGPNGELSGSPRSPVNLSVTAGHENWTSQRGDLKKTLNFTLPPQWTTGTITLTAEIAGVQLSEDVTFQQARPVYVISVAIRYKGQLPNLSRIQNGFWWAFRVYPTTRINYVRGATIDWNRCLQFDILRCPLAEVNKRALLKELYTRYRLVNAYVYGWLPDAIWGGGAAWIHKDATGKNQGGQVAVGDDDANHGARIFAQEVAHLLKRPHTKAGAPGSCQNPTPNELSDWPTSYSDAKIQEWGLDGYGFGWLLSSSSAVKRPDATYDYMSYCGTLFDGNVWTSPWTYEHIYNETLKLQGGTLAAQSLSTAQPYFIASGLVFTDNTATLDPIWVISTTMPGENPPIGTAYCLEAQDAFDAVLVSHCFDLSFVGFHASEAINVDGFNLMLPYPSGVARVVLKKATTELAVQPVSPYAPVVTVVSPNGGETWSASGTYTVTWTASDADGDPLTYGVFYSPDGSNWMPVGTTFTETQVAVNTAELAGGSGVKVRVLATDGVNTSADESDASFSVERKGPQAYILSPEGDGMIPPSTPLFLQGYAYDLEDSTLEESTLRWTSSRDGDLGIGSQVLTTLSQGQHVITLTATDSNGNMATDTLNLFVGYKSYLPLILRDR